MGYYGYKSEAKDEGAVSQWNEGTLKNIRLHEAQEMINYGKVNPFNKSEDTGAWNFTIWKAGIDILYGEGQSKYKSEEINYINAIKNIVEMTIKLNPPFQKILTQRICDKALCYKSIYSNQGKIQKLLEQYEQRVKIFNDQHGLSTRNIEDFDEGL